MLKIKIKKISKKRSSRRSEEYANLQAITDSQKEEIEGYKKRLHKMVRIFSFI